MVSFENIVIDHFRGIEHLEVNGLKHVNVFLGQNGTSKSQKDMIKEKNRNYADTNHWNLMSEALQPLKTFLSLYLTD